MIQFKYCHTRQFCSVSIFYCFLEIEFSHVDLNTCALVNMEHVWLFNIFEKKSGLSFRVSNIFLWVEYKWAHVALSLTSCCCPRWRYITNISLLRGLDFHLFFKVYGPTQVKCRLLISSIFYIMNFRHFSEMQ